MSERRTVGIVGARGHTGAELLRILAGHPGVEVAYAGSRELAGRPAPHVEGLTYGDLGPEEVADLGLSAVLLALPNNVCGPFVAALTAETVIVDISADHRFDADWVYGLTEVNRDKIVEARRIANPGCYATAMQLAVRPFLDILGGAPAVFGVSGYSGAGTAPSPKNDPKRLADNLMPYALAGHTHEREASRHLGRPVRFMPHVHPAFRGLLVTASLPLAAPITADEAKARVASAYAGEALIEVQDEIPELRDGAGIPGTLIGGVSVGDDGHNVAVVAVEDNLLKGAAVQAVQNLNLALGAPELTAIL